MEKSNIEKFCWGTKEKIFECIGTPLIVDYLHIKKGGYSSIHKHIYQWNYMYVKKGKLAINYNDDRKMVIFNEGELVTICAGREHQFYGETDCEVIEIVTPFITVTRSDIIRLTERGIDK